MPPGADGLVRIESGMKRVIVASLLLLFLSACTPEKRSPDAIREDTARVTREATQDAKAMAKGVVEGLKDSGSVNVNKASSDQLMKLPGIDEATAQRIIDNRPYNDSYELVKKHVISKHQFDQIAEKVTSR